MKLFDFSLKLNGFDIDKARSTLEHIQSLSTAEYETYIYEKRREIVMYHLAHNSFFKQFGNNINLENWNSVPIMTKRHLQQPLKTRLSNDFSSKDIYVNKTSGSSGDPFIFGKDKWCHALTWAVIINRFNWYNIDFNKSRQGRFYGIPLNKKSYYKERLKDYFSNRFRFSVFDLSDKAFEKTLTKFKNSSFDYINGYTSPIVQFAKFLRKKAVVLSSICPTLKVCVVTSEMLFEDDKILLEKQFGVPVVNEYGASELDLIAFQNPNDEWQVNSETLYIEILDEKDRVLPLGEEGRIVITSLYNYAHPFIRYDIGDIGILSKKSTLKKPLLEKLIGRTNDIAILPSGKKAAGLTFYYITKSVIEDDGNVSEFIIEQLDYDHFMIKYVSLSKLTSEKETHIRTEMETYLEPNIKTTFQRLKKLERSKSGKLKQFISHIDN